MISIALLAQSRLPEISPQFFSSWFAVFLLLGGLCLMILTGFVTWLNLMEKLKARNKGDKKDGIEVSPNPLNIQKVPTLATREELEHIKRDIDADLSAMREAMMESERKSHGEVVAIHNRINQVAENTSAMKGRLDEIAQSLHELVKRSMK